MSNPTPRKPSKITITVNEQGFDALLESFEANTSIPDDLKDAIERRKRERREKKEREAREQGTPPSPNVDTPPTDAPAA